LRQRTCPRYLKFAALVSELPLCVRTFLARNIPGCLLVWGCTARLVLHNSGCRWMCRNIRRCSPRGQAPRLRALPRYELICVRVGASARRGPMQLCRTPRRPGTWPPESMSACTRIKWPKSSSRVSWTTGLSRSYSSAKDERVVGEDPHPVDDGTANPLCARWRRVARMSLPRPLSLRWIRFVRTLRRCQPLPFH